MRNDSGAKIQKVELKINPQIATDFIALSPFQQTACELSAEIGCGGLLRFVLICEICVIFG